MNLSTLELVRFGDELKKSAVPAVLGPDGRPAYQYEPIFKARLHRRWTALAETASHKEPDELTDEEKGAILYCAGVPHTIDPMTGRISFPPCGLKKIDGKWNVGFLAMGAKAASRLRPLPTP